MKDVERVNALNKMLLNANVVAYGAMVDLIKRTGRLDLDMSGVGYIDDFPAEIRVFTDNGLICLSITSVYLSGEDNLMVDGYDDDNEKIEDIARESMSDLIENASEKKYRFRLDYMDEELTVDEFIRGRMKKVVDSNIETMVESKAKSFVNELRKRYDMAFAAFVVDNMRKQNMLKEDKIAELLKDNPNEK